MLDIVYDVEGVAGARVWQWPGRVAIGIRPSPNAGADEVLHRVEMAVARLREEGERWEFGLLDEVF